MKVELGKQCRAASVRSASVNKDARTVEVTWAAGAAVKRGGFFAEPYIEELDMSPECVRMDRLTSGRAPVLNAHDDCCLEDVIGVVESATLDGETGGAILRFSRREDVAPIVQDIEDGIICNVSVGYRIHKAVRIDTEGQSMPTIRAIDWEPMEISMVPIGADADAHTRSTEEKVSCEFDSPEVVKPATVPGPALIRLQIEVEQEY